jgi:hypothetical protein
MGALLIDSLNISNTNRGDWHVLRAAASNWTKIEYFYVVELYPLTTNAKSCSDLAEIFSVASLYHILCFDFLSRTVKKLLAISLFLFLEFFYSALFRNMFQNSVLGISLMS